MKRVCFLIIHVKDMKKRLNLKSDKCRSLHNDNCNNQRYDIINDENVDNMVVNMSFVVSIYYFKRLLFKILHSNAKVQICCPSSVSLHLNYVIKSFFLYSYCCMYFFSLKGSIFFNFFNILIWNIE